MTSQVPQAEWELDLSSCSRDDGVAIDFDDLCDAELVVPIAPLKLPQEEEEEQEQQRRRQQQHR